MLVNIIQLVYKQNFMTIEFSDLNLMKVLIKPKIKFT